jgi:mannose-6-phosphate isomerase-like protein (cupin superfamily)
MEYLDTAALADDSSDFRRVLWTGAHTQLVVMTIPVGEEIGSEVHDGNDQILSFVRGSGTADVAGDTRTVNAGDIVVVPAGTRHNFVNTGTEPLVLMTVYGPPDHDPGTVHRTKAEADAAEAEEHGKGG